MILPAMLNALSNMTRLGMVSIMNLTSPWLGAIRCNWLVCNLPLSPMAVRHTMSSLPMLVTPRISLWFDFTSGLGVRQNRYCLES
jgi:hypothetical protein